LKLLRLKLCDPLLILIYLALYYIFVSSHSYIAPI
jgi:hypothetical protein